MTGRVIIAGGGTGGHLFPALAVAGELRELGIEEVHFVGTDRGIEARVLPREGYPLHTVAAEGFRGRGIRSLRAIGKLLLGYVQSIRLLRSLRPCCVLGMGGYASLSMGLAAATLRVPLFLHEQNVICGLANKLLFPFAREVFLSYPRTKGVHRRAKVRVTGNPVRKELLHAQEDPTFFGISPGKRVVLVFGGSQGARRINEAVVGSLGLLSEYKDDLAFIHQTGKGYEREIGEAYASAGIEAHVTPFIYEMGKAYATARLVVCRAGATTLAEVTALGKPCILIPFPHAAGAHQLQNAKALEEQGAAIVLTEDELAPAALGKMIVHLMANGEVLKSMAREARRLGRPQAAHEIAVRCLEAAGDRR